MTPPSHLMPPLRFQGSNRLNNAILLRVLLALVFACLAIFPSLAAENETMRLILRGDLTARSDTLSVGDLVEAAPDSIAQNPLFRAPALGASGTIQTKRVVDALKALGFERVETGGRAQISVSRAARRIGSDEIEKTIKAGLKDKLGLDSDTMGFSFDQPPALLVSTDITQRVVVEDLSYDPRSRRLSGLAWVGRSSDDRHASLRFSGQLMEMVDVPILNRSLERGDTIKAGDIVLERRTRDGLMADMEQTIPALLSGRISKKPLIKGAVLRTADLARPDVVARNDLVNVNYVSPNMILTLRARALENGAIGDVISVLNPQSKKTLQATISGSGQVTILQNALPPGTKVASEPRLQPSFAR